MTIQDDMNVIIKEYEKKSPEEKSGAAIYALRRFDQVIESIERGEDRLDQYITVPQIATCFPPTVRNILEDYIDGEWTEEEAIDYIREAQSLAEAYLIENGYDLSIARDAQRSATKEAHTKHVRARSLVKQITKSLDQEN